MTNATNTNETKVTETSYEDQVRSALARVAPTSAEHWLEIGRSIKSEFGEDGFAIFKEWTLDEFDFSHEGEDKEIEREKLANFAHSEWAGMGGFRSASADDQVKFRMFVWSVLRSSN
jgi:hypothetical protein